MPSQAMEEDSDDARRHSDSENTGALDLSKRSQNQPTQLQMRDLSPAAAMTNSITTSCQTADIPHSVSSTTAGGWSSVSTNSSQREYPDHGVHEVHRPPIPWSDESRGDSPSIRHTQYLEYNQQSDPKHRLQPLGTFSDDRIVPPTPYVTGCGMEVPPNVSDVDVDNLGLSSNRHLMFSTTDGGMLFNPMLPSSVMSPTSANLPNMFDPTQPSLTPISSSSFLLSRKRRHDTREREKKERESATNKASSTATVTSAETSSSSQDGFEADAKKGKMVPEERKDDAYWERRRKNNEAAKRSRDARRQKEEEIAIRAAFLEQENLKLRAQVAILKNETAKLHCLLYNNRRV